MREELGNQLLGRRPMWLCLGLCLGLWLCLCLGLCLDLCLDLRIGTLMAGRCPVLNPKLWALLDLRHRDLLLDAPRRPRHLCRASPIVARNVILVVPYQANAGRLVNHLACHAVFDAAAFKVLAPNSLLAWVDIVAADWPATGDSIRAGKRAIQLLLVPPVAGVAKGICEHSG